MEGIYEPAKTFPFDKMVLASPTVISGGNYFLKMLMNNGPLYIQMPKSKTKGGIVQSGKRQYCDLLFTNENEDMIQWMEDLESFACQYIYDNREKWFETEMELTDIENYFASPLKTYRSGKYYLARANIPQRLGKIHLKIFDEDHNSVEPDTINDKMDMVSIVEVQGIKCSARSFQFEFEIKQLMTLEVKDMFENCLLSPTRKDDASTHLNTHIPTESPVETEPMVETEPRLVNESSIVSELENFLQDSNEQIHTPPPTLEKVDALEFMEIETDKLSNDDVVHIKDRNDVYYELYRDARKKAHIAKRMAFDAYLEANKIKKAYDLNTDSEDDMDDMDDMGQMEQMDNFR